jgi:hypothetical protein
MKTAEHTRLLAQARVTRSTPTATPTQGDDAMQLYSVKVMQASAADEDEQSMAIHTNLAKASLLVECSSDTLDNPQHEQPPPQRRTVENINHSNLDGDNIRDGDQKLDGAAATDAPCEDETKPKNDAENDPAAAAAAAAAANPPPSDDVAVTFPQRVRRMNLLSHKCSKTSQIPQRGHFLLA